MFVKAENIITYNNPAMMLTIYSCMILISWVSTKYIMAGELTTGNLTATMSGVNEFTEWKLTGTSLSVAGNAAESWVNVSKIEILGRRI